MIHGRRDVTHGPIRDRLRLLGASVRDDGDAGRDKPDLLVGILFHDFQVECKSQKKVHHQSNEASDGQDKFAAGWRGAPVTRLRSVEDAQEWYLRTREKLIREREIIARSAVRP
jgi:hypothetical protein